MNFALMNLRSYEHMYSWSFIYVPFLVLGSIACATAASGVFARGVCACALRWTPAVPHWLIQGAANRAKVSQWSGQKPF